MTTSELRRQAGIYAKAAYFTLSLILLSGINPECAWTLLALPNFLLAALVLKTVNPNDIKEWR